MADVTGTPGGIYTVEVTRTDTAYVRIEAGSPFEALAETEARVRAGEALAWAAGEPDVVGVVGVKPPGGAA